MCHFMFVMLKMEVRSLLTLAFLINLSVLVVFVESEEILGCGGFLKSHADIDFSKVEIKLLTKQGSLKDKTDCSPSNGYYFIPVYDKGEYILKISPPPGWSFEPESVELNFNGKSDICSQGKDVNFNFKGFGITGKIALAGQIGGAKDVAVTLQSEDGADTRKTVSDINGIFSFTPVIPGKYVIKATHNKWHFSKSEYNVMVQTGNTELPENTLVVSGFDVQGKFSSSGQTLSNVGVVIFKETGQQLISDCAREKLPVIAPGNPNFDSNPICYSPVEKNGEFTFKAVAPGKYLVKPAIDNKDLKLYIQPQSIEFQVSRDTVVLKESFEITGFSVTGKVLTSASGKAIANADVKLNGQIVTKTNAAGSYALENMKSGTYTLLVEAENLQFAEQTIKLSLSNPTLPDITVSAFKVCGDVISERNHVVRIFNTETNFQTTTMTKQGSTNWCTYLPSGAYSIEVLTTSDDKASGIQLFPLTQNIEVISSPVSGIVFSQLKATVTGEIKCLPDSSNNCRSAEVTLRGMDSSGRPTGQNLYTQAEGGKYKFENILPGSYEVTIPQLNLCWKATTIELNVKSAHEQVAPFYHEGYEISIISSHKAHMQYTHRSAQKTTAKPSSKIELMSGVNAFCVERAGEYDIIVQGCHTYDSSLPKSFTTSDTNPVIITAVAHKTGIRILATERIAEPFKMLIESKNGKNVATLSLESQKVDGYYSHRFETYLQLDESITFTPQSSVMLFKPETKEIIGGNDCMDVAFSFIATQGLIIEGKIVPKIQDAKVTLSFPKNPELPAIESASSANGEFKFGPIDSTLQYELKAEKESYVFSNYDSVKNEFNAHKLCEIIVVVNDGASGNRLSGVLLSLSGAESYRKNLVTGDDGKIKFHSLSPSQYFLRPMMKEYKFNPNSKIIDVKDGETSTVELSGERVAYSVFGTIKSLNGDPFPNVIVEAISNEECLHHQEESTSAVNGQYRIRALKPGCIYTVRPKQDEANSNVERSIPPTRTVSIANEDITGIDLIAISPYAFVDVKARVFASSNDHYKSLHIQMYRKGSVDSPIYSQRVESPLNVKSSYNPGILVFFPNIPMDGRTYFVELKTSVSDKMYKYSLPAVQFLANTSSIYVELEFNPELKTGDGDLNQNSISALILVALVAIAFFKQDLAMDFLNFVWTRLNSVVHELMQRQNKKKDNRYTETINYKEIEELAEGINAIKKKKTKKI